MKIFRSQKQALNVTTKIAILGLALTLNAHGGQIYAPNSKYSCDLQQSKWGELFVDNKRKKNRITAFFAVFSIQLGLFWDCFFIIEIYPQIVSYKSYLIFSLSIGIIWVRPFSVRAKSILSVLYQSAKKNLNFQFTGSC